MPAPAHHWPPETHPYGPYEADERYVDPELSAGERIGPPPARAGRKALICVVVLLLALGGGWAALGDQLTWPKWLSLDLTNVMAALERKAPTRAEPAAAAPPAPLQPLVSREITAAAGMEAKPPVSPVTTASLGPAANPVDEAPITPLPPPVVDAGDPHQKRAVAVGLHPGLSRVLLTRLSAEDYRNAGVAIQTAIAETADTDVYVWPRQRKPDLALFQVSFVQGAAADCRRYVVKVTKDGWLTTALPMEKCGVKPRRQAAARKE